LFRVSPVGNPFHTDTSDLCLKKSALWCPLFSTYLTWQAAQIHAHKSLAWVLTERVAKMGRICFPISPARVPTPMTNPRQSYSKPDINPPLCFSLLALVPDKTGKVN
ncbi:MAG: hypothetical protein OEV91_11045, partial [Desulfobulbaceae bacterium]|nr:hypothetical protein [Desulfobulbaceae bacterium]